MKHLSILVITTILLVSCSKQDLEPQDTARPATQKLFPVEDAALSVKAETLLSRMLQDPLLEQWLKESAVTRDRSSTPEGSRPTIPAQLLADYAGLRNLSEQENRSLIKQYIKRKSEKFLSEAGAVLVESGDCEHIYFFQKRMAYFYAMSLSSICYEMPDSFTQAACAADVGITYQRELDKALQDYYACKYSSIF